MKKFNVEIVYTGILNETVEAESVEEAEFEARDIATMELPGNIDEYTISVQEEE
ncbi:hypothetical protein [Staphylococcus pasteuri]|uniref:hypothetical protein n=1 Tax=Staphylococcus pasteuri TaxID=45972 RepID=UPI0016498264|nr:hypothetical protein [Staphylococcus pasteuri]